MSDYADDMTRTNTFLSHAVWCATMSACSLHEKEWRMMCTVYTLRRLQQIASSCERKLLRIGSTSFWKCSNSTRNHLRKKGAIFVTVEKESVLDVLFQILGGDGSSMWLRFGSLIGVSSVHSCPICSVWDTNVFDTSETHPWKGGWSGLPVPIYPLRCTSPRSSQFWAANHDILDLDGNDREFHQSSFWYISSAVSGPRNAVSVPSTSKSTLLDNVVLNWESVQSPLMKAGFTFFQEMSTSGMDNSLILIIRACWALHFWNCFA